MNIGRYLTLRIETREILLVYYKGMVIFCRLMTVMYKEQYPRASACVGTFNLCTKIMYERDCRHTIVRTQIEVAL